MTGERRGLVLWCPLPLAPHYHILICVKVRRKNETRVGMDSLRKPHSGPPFHREDGVAACVCRRQREKQRENNESKKKTNDNSKKEQHCGLLLLSLFFCTDVALFTHMDKLL